MVCHQSVLLYQQHTDSHVLLIGSLYHLATHFIGKCIEKVTHWVTYQITLLSLLNILGKKLNPKGNNPQCLLEGEE